MRTSIVLAALAALTACNQRDAAPEAQASETGAAAPAQTTTPVMAADGKSPVGKFRITTSDGKLYEEELKPDGTYVGMADGKVAETGRWTQKAPDTFCYTEDKAGAKEKCNKEVVDAQGVWTSTDPDGKTATVVRVET